MSCCRANRLLSAFIDDELSGCDKLAVREHLRVCAACREEYESLLSMKRLLAGLSVSEPRPDFEDELLERLHLAAETEPVRAPATWLRTIGPRWRPAARAALALVAGAAVAALALALSRPIAWSDREVRAANLLVPTAPSAERAPRLADMLFLHDDGAPYVAAEAASYEPTAADSTPVRVETALDLGSAALDR